MKIFRLRIDQFGGPEYRYVLGSLIHHPGDVAGRVTHFALPNADLGRVVERIQVVGSVGDNPTPFVDENSDFYPVPTGAALTAAAFEKGLGRLGGWIVGLGVVLFAYSTMIAWP